MADLTQTLIEADALLRIARTALQRMRLEGLGSDCRLSHEVRMFALEFSRESRDGPGVLQVNGTGRALKCLEAISDALAQQAEPVQRAPETGAASYVPSPSFQMNAHADPPINAMDFGVPPLFAERAENYARWALAQQADRELTSDRITELAVLARLLNPPQIGAHWSAPLPGSDYPDRLQVFAQCVAAEIEKQQAEPVQDFRLTECVFVGPAPAPHEDWHHAIAAMLREKHISGLRISAATADDWNGGKEQQRKPLTEEEIINIGKEARAKQVVDALTNERDALRDFAMYYTRCPCCQREDKCDDDRTFASDDPNAAEEMDVARAAIAQTKGGGNG